MSAAKESWPRVRLGDVCEIRAGDSAPQDKKLFNGGRFPFVRMSDVGAVHYGVLRDSRDKLNEAGISKLHLFKTGSILFPKSGASTFLNHRVILGIDAYVVSHLAVIIPREKVDGKFLLNLLAQVDAKDLMQDTSYPALRTSEISEIEFCLPPLPVQREIVARLERELGAVDELAKKFEELAQAAEAEFKATLKETFGEISRRGAETRRLGEVCEIKAGGDKPEVFSIDRSEQCDIPVISNGIENNGVCGYTDKATIKGDCVTISARGTIGWVCVRRSPFVPIVRLVVVKPASNIDVGFLALGLQQLQIEYTGSSIPQLTVPMVRDFSLPLPPLPTQREIVARLDAAKARKDKLVAAAKRGAGGAAVWRKAILKEAFE